MHNDAHTTYGDGPYKRRREVGGRQSAVGAVVVRYTYRTSSLVHRHHDHHPSANSLIRNRADTQVFDTARLRSASEPQNIDRLTATTANSRAERDTIGRTEKDLGKIEKIQNCPNRFVKIEKTESAIMATYAGYRHIELDRVGCSKKRVRNPPSDIFNVLCTPPSSNGLNGSFTPRRSHEGSSHDNSFKRLFGSPDVTPARKSSLAKADSANRNPVTGDGVVSWDSKPDKRSSRVYTERNPVTGEFYTIVSPSSTPTKIITNGLTLHNGTSTPIPKKQVHAIVSNGTATNGEA